MSTFLTHTAQHTALEPKKDMTYAYFENVAVSGMDNYVKVTSHSAGGSEYDEQHFNLYESYTSFWGEWASSFLMFIIWTKVEHILSRIRYINEQKFDR